MVRDELHSGDWIEARSRVNPEEVNHMAANTGGRKKCVPIDWEIVMDKRIIGSIVVTLTMIVAVVCYNSLRNGTVTGSATVEGYVKQVYPGDGRILICYKLENTRTEEYMGDCYIPIEEDTVFSDGRTLDSVQQGEHIIATYTGTLAEIYPAEIDGTVSIQLQ